MSFPAPPAFANFVELLRWRAQTHPDAMALGWFAQGETLSEALNYAELDLRARAWAVTLLQRQSPGSRALLVFPPGLDFMAAFAGCLYAGLIPVPAYPPEQHRLQHSLRRILAVIADAQADLVLTVPAFQKMAESLLLQSGAAVAPGLSWLTPQDLVLTAAGQWVMPALQPVDLAFLQYTSGSTGHPKGVMISHANLLANMAMIQRSFEHGERENTLVCWVPFYHDMGLVGHLLQSLYIGGRTLIMSPLDFLRKPLRWLQLISDWRATSTGAPNFAFDLCVRKIRPEERDSLDLSSLRLLLNGAEPVQYRSVMQFLEYFAPAGLSRDALYPAYGMAEATVFIAGSPRARRPVSLHVDRLALEAHRVEPLPAQASAALPLISSGVVEAPGEIRIVAPESRLPLPAGQVGEIWLRGPHIAAGYWRRAEETAAAFQAQLADGSAETWLRTGDLGFLWNQDLYVTGRLKDMILIRGRNLYPQDLEQAMLSLHEDYPALRPGCGVALGLPGEDTEVLVLLHEVTPPLADPMALCRDLALRIEVEFEVAPRQIFLLAPGVLPKTSSGKLMRTACKQALSQGAPDWEILYRWPPPAAPERPPAPNVPIAADPVGPSEIEAWLRQWLSQELELTAEQIAPQLPLQALGLDSALAVRLHADLENYLGRRLSPALIWDHPSLERLLAALSGDSVLPGERSQLRQPPLAVLAMACRFPGAEYPEAFWELLLQGRDALGPPPAGRFGEGSGLLRGGYLPDVASFDAAWFGISAREAESMDPQQRLILELVWEALEQAGIRPESLRGSETGVFVALSGSDYAQRSLYGGASTRNGTAVTGAAFSVAAGRVAYLLGTEGPALTVDTACSSALTAVHLACQSLAAGECTLAIVAAANLILTPDVTQAFLQAGALSPTGECRAFSARAEGYVRSEGGGALILKPLAEHQPLREPLRGIIRATALNHNGLSQGLTAPNGQAQQKLLQTALQRAGWEPEQLGYVEAHGTGTPLGDPIEFAALHAVFGQRSPEQPLWVGALKSQLGHLEAAAGMAGLIKTLLVLEQGLIPPNLYGEPPNPKILPLLGPLQLPRACQPWTSAGIRRAGVSSFGISGTNAHVLLEQPPDPAPQSSPPGPRVILLSARSAQGFRQLTERLRAHLPEDLSHLAATLWHYRSQHPWRWAGVAADRADLLAQLEQAECQQILQAPELIWVFPGQGGQWPGMGLELLAREPVFREAWHACREAFEPWIACDLEALLQDWESERLDQIQPLLCAWQICLARLWLARGIRPQAVIGHSMGEVAAACVAGILSLPAAAQIICRRSQLMQSLPPSGGMLVTDLDWEAARNWESTQVVRAVCNAPGQTVLAGERLELARIQSELEASGRFCRPIAVTVASHSPQVESLLPAIETALSGLSPQAGQIPLISTVTGELLSGQEMDAAYWAANLRQPVRFDLAVQTAQQLGNVLFLEISPHPLLTPGLQQQGLSALDCGRRHQSEAESLLRTLAELAHRGMVFHGEPEGPPLPLPPTPWERQSYWLTAPSEPSALTLPDPLPEPEEPAWHPWRPVPAPRPASCLLLGGTPEQRQTLLLLLESWGLSCHWQAADSQAFSADQTSCVLWLEALHPGGVLPAPQSVAGSAWVVTEGRAGAELTQLPWTLPMGWRQLDLDGLGPAQWSQAVPLLGLGPGPAVALRQRQFWLWQSPSRKTPPEREPTAPDPAQTALSPARLRAEIGAMLRLNPDQLDWETPLDQWGFDSLLALELRRRLEALSGQVVPADLLRRGVSLAEIFKRLS